MQGHTILNKLINSTKNFKQEKDIEDIEKYNKLFRYHSQSQSYEKIPNPLKWASSKTKLN